MVSLILRTLAVTASVAAASARMVTAVSGFTSSAIGASSASCAIWRFFVFPGSFFVFSLLLSSSGKAQNSGWGEHAQDEGLPARDEASRRSERQAPCYWWRRRTSSFLNLLRTGVTR